MSDTELDREMVYVAYRDVFKGKLAQLRKRPKVRNVVEKHKNHLHHKQLADSMDSEKTYKILRSLLADGLFESDSAAQAAFPVLFSPGNGMALIVKCVEDGFEADNGRRDENRPDAPQFPDTLRSPDAPVPNDTSPESALMVIKHRIDRKGRIRKPTRAVTKSAGPLLHMGEGKDAEPKEVIRGDRARGRDVLKRTRGREIIPTDPTHLPSRLQHLILTETQRLLEECCYNFAEKWFPSMLEVNGWDAPEAVELNKWGMILSKCDIPVAATALSPGQSLAGLFRNARKLRNCAVHRLPHISVQKVEEMVRDAWLLSQALRDDIRATQLLHWHKELENLVVHLQLRTNSQREAAEAELQNIHNAKVEIEENLVELESRAMQLTHSLEAEGRSHRPIDIELLRPLEEALGNPTLARAPLVTALDQAWRWVGNRLGMMVDLKNAGWSHSERDS
ncbi:hypothetical protein L207DRAFT_592059 [Hyaloscypha variabilis F]|uniref:Uncharacterized protein n=1 Tax=Hyaloscypha variabilis (strain UAMH 11265 / GT02V1 / F) TaxID=1149755 RepID=A0A2J6QXX8_HYAVF|nr:hypothetical protein L207DRAFT_592059 [Hyaloscypha variabilis F]